MEPTSFRTYPDRQGEDPIGFEEFEEDRLPFEGRDFDHRLSRGHPQPKWPGERIQRGSFSLSSEISGPHRPGLRFRNVSDASPKWVVFLARHDSDSCGGAHPYPGCSPVRSPPIHGKSTGQDHPRPETISDVRRSSQGLSARRTLFF
jgi:hypothetical protein